MAKRKKQRQQQAETALTYKEVARARRDTKLRRRVALAGGAIAAVIGIILIFGIVNELIIKPGQPIAQVDDTEITTTDFQDRVHLERALVINQYLQFADMVGVEQAYQYSRIAQLYQLTSTGLLDQYEEFGGQVLDTMTDEVLIRQAAAEIGLEVSDQEISQFIEEQVGYYRDGTPTPQPTPTPWPTSTPITPTDTLPTPIPTRTPLPTPTVVTQAAFEELYQEQLDTLEVSKDSYQVTVETMLLVDKVREWLMEDAPREADQVELDMLFFAAEGEANDYLARLEAGEESFDDLVDEAHANQEDGINAASVPWTPSDDLAERTSHIVAQLAFSLEVGGHSQVVTTNDGQFILFQVTNREEKRELSDSALRSKEDSLYTTWLEELREAAEINKYDDWISRVPKTPALDLQSLMPTPTPEG